MTLPTEVVMVSMYTSPVVSSLTTQLELTLEMPGDITSPMDIVPMGISQPISMTSGVFRQAITLAKPWGGVGSHLMPVLLLVGEMPVATGPLISRVVGLLGSFE